MLTKVELKWLVHQKVHELAEERNGNYIYMTNAHSLALFINCVDGK